MSSIFISFPKSECFYGRALDTQRIYSSIFKDNLELLKSDNITVKYLLEDKLAYDLVQSCGLKNTKMLTTIAPSDITFAESYPELYSLEDYVFNKYSDAEPTLFDSESKYTSPMSLIREGKDLYLKKRKDVASKRTKYCLDNILSNEKYVMQFRTGTNTDRGISVCSTSCAGDGRLCIEVLINSNLVRSYYGGVHIEKEYLQTILNL